MARIVRQTKIGVKISKHPATAKITERPPQVQGEHVRKDEFSPAFINAESHRAFVTNLFAIRGKTTRSGVKPTPKSPATASI